MCMDKINGKREHTGSNEGETRIQWTNGLNNSVIQETGE
jgi:hypothetical protein